MADQNIIFTIVMFLFTIGVLVVFHEFGHFWVARRLGVKVLRFSVGFGKPLWTWRRKNDPTEYVFSPILLGGYVKMLDSREDPVPKDEQHMEFNNQSLRSRSAIILAGPFANLLFAIVAYWMMFMLGVPGLKPVIGSVEPKSIAAAAGLKANDEIISIDGRRTPTWESARYALLENVISQRAIEMMVSQQGYAERKISLALDRLENTPEPGMDLIKIGMRPWPINMPIVGHVEPKSAAQKYGLQVGDQVLEQDGVAITTWEQWVNEIRKSPGKQVTLKIKRVGVEKNINIVPGKRESEQGTVGFLGVAPKRPEIPEFMYAMDRYGPIDAIGQACLRSWQMSTLTLKMIWKLIIGQASLQNLSGPISIAKFAGYTASKGVTAFLSFLAIVSISLFIINLLPIPILDGGHLVLFVAEAIKGKPVSDMVQIQFRTIGFVMVMLLMSLAIYNDIIRWF